jgi:hypothetical protein
MSSYRFQHISAILLVVVYTTAKELQVLVPFCHLVGGGLAEAVGVGELVIRAPNRTHIVLTTTVVRTLDMDLTSI